MSKCIWNFEFKSNSDTFKQFVFNIRTCLANSLQFLADSPTSYHYPKTLFLKFPFSINSIQLGKWVNDAPQPPRRWTYWNSGHFIFTLASLIPTRSCVNLIRFTWLNDSHRGRHWRLSDSMHMTNRPFWFRPWMVPGPPTPLHYSGQEWSRVIWCVDAKGNVDSPSHHQPSHLNRRISRTTHSKNRREYE